MKRYGFIEDQNLLNDPNGYELHPEQFAGHASEIAKQGVDLVVFLNHRQYVTACHTMKQSACHLPAKNLLAGAALTGLWLTRL